MAVIIFFFFFLAGGLSEISLTLLMVFFLDQSMLSFYPLYLPVRIKKPLVREIIQASIFVKSTRAEARRTIKLQVIHPVYTVVNSWRKFVLGEYS